MTPHEHYKQAEKAIDQAKNPRLHFSGPESHTNDFRLLLLKIADAHMKMIEFSEKYNWKSNSE